MKIFKAIPDEDYPYNYFLSATHKWKLPGVGCTECGCIGGIVGLAYPTIELLEGVDPKPYEDPWPIPPDRLRTLSNVIRNLIPSDLPLGAGTEFGPLRGKGWGKFGDFTWLNPWTPLISETALQKLEAHGVTGLVAVKTDIRLRSKKPFRYLELQGEPHVHLAPSCDPYFGEARCPSCGFAKRRKDESALENELEIEGKSFPKDRHLARIYEWPSITLVTEHFVKTVQKERFSDIKFLEVIVSQ